MEEGRTVISTQSPQERAVKYFSGTGSQAYVTTEVSLHEPASEG